jgi:hypothetical protein
VRVAKVPWEAASASLSHGALCSAACAFQTGVLKI